MDPALSLKDVQPTPFWLDDPARPQAHSALVGDARCDLLVVGGGYSGLWTALIAKERDPSLDVVLIEGKEVGWAASGRNGGFCAASLTHGLGNGLERWPDELERLEHLGAQNLQAIEDSVRRHGIDCDWERTGEIDVATEPYQLDGLHELAELARSFGADCELLDADAMRAQVNSPSYLGGFWDKDGVAMVNPAKLAWGLKQACLDQGVRIFEHTLATDIAESGAGMAVRTAYGRVFAGRVALGTNVFPSLVRRVRPYVVPVYDYALMTEPLNAEQLASIGWQNRQGLGDSANQFHYYRLSADNRILWGGYDAIYNFGGKVRAEYDQRPQTNHTLATHFFQTFPQLEGLRFTHAWGGAIDTCTRFSAFFDTAYKGKVAYAAGYTGLGVGATRFGAEVMLDLLGGKQTERTALEMVRRKPLPFPPEPVRWAGIELTKWSLDRADRNAGRRNVWLKTLDRLGLGFDS
ncbi:glycine/D-amino acid oxidase-like deaminating enzyme [Kitasatospora sp. MAA4]|uniref:NAD(P)/FAD-dependent oxidoreductase n=1 Tax=Kitasatospora sp. MAA4 TaxID=3035093 RepID=UPI002475E398|nr:FAD-dependent oxidoreductase [Kitasatospora sp. MAA4]MDH6132544.1 glycine/D-amino acid oxidase-like deaminating enzyme [Kitasatospora sp. MAA4]